VKVNATCDDSPCNGGECTVISKPNKRPYKCKCLENFKGPNCELNCNEGEARHPFCDLKGPKGPKGPKSPKSPKGPKSGKGNKGPKGQKKGKKNKN
jgi:hypothetical protein